MATNSPGGVSRRKALKTALAAVGSGTAALAGRSAAAGQAGGPASSNGAGRRFRGFVRIGTTGGVQQLTLRPIGPRQVIVRTEAIQAAYTRTGPILGTGDIGQPTMPGNGGVGVVEAIGEAGSNALKDVASFIRLMETRQYDMGSVVANNTYSLDRIKEAFQTVADRTVVGAAVVVFS